MARMWKGARSDATRFYFRTFPMGDFEGSAPVPHYSRDSKLDPEFAYFVAVCGFTFEFWSVEQIQHALHWFEKKLHPSSRLPDERACRHRHDDLQRWYERLPQYLQEKGKREKVVKALRNAVTRFS